jgi:hypothetical protein
MAEGVLAEGKLLTTEMRDETSWILDDGRARETSHLSLVSRYM